MVVAAKQKPRNTTHHKKRRGSHQKRSTHFMKAYWPYLPIALIVGVGMLVNTLWAQSGVLSYATNMTATGLLSNTNTERAKSSLGALSLNGSLSQAAQAKAVDMVNRDYWSHTTPDGQDPWIFIDNTGYKYLAAGENLAYGFNTHNQTVVGWMNSPGHRANILNGQYNEVGFGIANSPNYQGNGQQTVVVAMYAKSAVASANIAADPAPTAPAPAPAPSAAPAPPQQTTSQSSEPAATSSPDSTARTEQPLSVGQNITTGQSDDISVSATVPGDQKVARVQIATSGAAPWSLLVASVLAIGLLVVFIARHSLAWHRAVVKGETFFLKHKFLDIFIVAGIVVAALLSQTAGFIQ